MILHCFSMPDRLDECLAEGWWISFAGNVTYPKAGDLADAAERVPDDRLLVETDAPYLTPQAVRKERNQPAFVAHTARFVAERRGVAYEELERLRRAQRRRAVRLVTGDAPRPSRACAGMRQFGVRPKRDLGQNFLVDSNILGVIERAAELGADDVVLEIGGGLACSASTSRARAAHVHVVELDRALVPALRGRARRRIANTTLHVADAMTLDLARARPGADEGRRQPALRHRGERDPAHDRGARRRHALGGDGPAEVGERFAAAPGHRGLRRALRARPAGLRRARAPRDLAHGLPPGAQRRLGARRARPHRPGGAAGAARARARRASRTGARRWRARSRWRRAAAPACATAPARRSRRSAIPADVRAERLAPEDFRALRGGAARRRARRCRRRRRPAKINLCLFLGPARADGRHELVTVFQPCAGRRGDARAGGARHGDGPVVCPGVEGENLAAAALRRSARATGWDGAPVRLRIDKRIPVAAGMAGG